MTTTHSSLSSFQWRRFAEAVGLERAPSAPRRLLRLTDAGEYLHISPGTLRGIIQRGELPIVKLGENGHSPWLLDIRDLDEWINRTKVTL